MMLGHGAHAVQRGALRRAIRDAPLRGLRARSGATSWASTTACRRTPTGRPRSPAFDAEHDPRSCAPRGRDPQHDHLRLVAAARASWRAALLGGDRAGRDAGRHRPAGRRLAFGHGSTNGIGVPRIDVAGPELPLPLNPARSIIPVARMADMLLDPGASYAFNGRRYTYPDVRLVYWAGGNPFHHHQDLNRLARAWQKPETVIVHEQLVDADRAPRRHRAAGDHHARAQRRRRLLARPVHSRHASRHRSGGRGARTTSTFSARSPQRLGYERCLHRRPRRDGLVPMGLRSGARERGRQGRDAAGLPAVLGGRVRRAAAARARLRAVRGFSPRSGAPSAEDAVGTHRDRLRSGRRLRLCGLPAASGLDTAGRMARRRRWPSAGRSTW